MQVLYVRWQNHFRKLVDGRGECCETCRRPHRYRIFGSDYRLVPHRCRSRRGARQVIDDEDEIVDEEQCEGARIERGFAMMSLSDSLDFGGEIR